MEQEFFPQRPKINPTIYVYQLIEVKSHNGYIKIGYTERDVNERIQEQLHTSAISYKILYQESSICSDGTVFNDKDVHKILKRNGFLQLNQGKDRNEWFNCKVEDVKVAINELKTGVRHSRDRIYSFKMRPEQEKAVERTVEYYNGQKKYDKNSTPKFLWNAKMRFGKTFASYKLAERMNFKRILIMTFKPAVESSWQEDLVSHIDFEDWQFISNKDAQYEQKTIDTLYNEADKNKPIVVFGSFQDLLGTNENGGIKAKNEFIHTTSWDLVIFDEYHYGAWREKASNLFERRDEEQDYDFDYEKYKKDEADNAYNESFLPISTDYYLFLSGTPFRALNSGEFIEEQIFSWTYGDEQKAKMEWNGENNPYEALPRMVMMTYKIPDSITQIALQGEFNEFDLNVFFQAEGKGKDAKFIYKSEVQKWLDLIRGSFLPSNIDDLKLGQDKRPPMPYSDARLLNILTHTLWFLPNVASCDAMENLLREKQNTFYSDYKIINCSGTKAGIGLAALTPVRVAMGDPLKTKTITLSCGKLTTGITVKPWTGVFMLRNLKSPESYFQTAFRAQSPWELTNEEGKKEIIKKECYIFDFALDRALKEISDYSCQLDAKESNPEKCVANFINFLPVLAYDGSSMKQINAQDVLDIAMAGTSATLLAKRWESALLVNVDNGTLKRLMEDKEALSALMRIEGFRSLNSNTIEIIINRSEKIKKVKAEGEDITKKEKQELSREEKEIKSLRKQVQEKLIKFATRIPVFMYLTDYRERSLQDVITQLEPKLFKQVTGLDTKDFELLCSIGVFNSSLMNEAIFKFKRYEDASLSYTGIDKHENDENIGGWDTEIRKQEYEIMYYNQKESIKQNPFDKIVTQANEFENKEINYSNQENDKINSKYIIPEEDDIYNHDIKEQMQLLESLQDGSIVFHEKFGRGEIIWFDKKRTRIKVSFGNNIEKTFLFPDAIMQGHLKRELITKN